MNPFALSCFFTAALTAILGLFVLLKNPKNKANQAWFFTAIAVFIWTVGLGGTGISGNKEDALFWQRILYIGTILIPIFFFNFCITFLGRNNKVKIIFIIGSILSIFFLFLLFTKLFVTKIAERTSFGYWPVETGSFYWLFLIYFIFYVVYSVILLKVDSKKYDGIYQKQIQYIYYAALIGFVGGSTNFLLDFNLNIYPIGNYFVALYVIFISYAILKHHLFNVRVIATELFTLAICIILLVRTLLSKNLQEGVTNGGIFISVVLFGVLLIRSVLKEVEQREQIESMANQIRKAYEIEKKARKKIQELGEAKTQFIMATQHHLRTPLTSMRGYLDLIFGGTYGRVPEKLKETLLKFQVSNSRLIRIVNELLDITQFQLGKKAVVLGPNIQIEPILEEIIEELKFTAKTKGIYLKFEKPEETMPNIKADVEKLKVALFNILDNAIKYTTKGGITIKLKTQNSKLKIISQDTGIGITEEQFKTLFTGIFERGEEAKKVFTTGRGIGLYIASKIIQAHQGRVWAESEGKGKGSTFYVELPVG